MRALGATLVLEPGFAFPAGWCSCSSEQYVTGLPGVPTVFQRAALAVADLRERELPAAALPDQHRRGAARRDHRPGDAQTFPNARLYSMYGLTECKRATYLPPVRARRRARRRSGIAIPGTEAWVEDEDGERRGPGEVGELMIRGAHVMQGYWNDPGDDGGACGRGAGRGSGCWRRGDLFRADEEGYLYFVGRRDDLIKSGGEKVVPREVEDVLHTAPGVQEAAVVGVPDQLLGQAVHAHCRHRAATLEETALRAYCADRLEDHMVPRRIVIHDELPRTSNGKVDRRVLAGGRARPGMPDELHMHGLLALGCSHGEREDPFMRSWWLQSRWRCLRVRRHTASRSPPGMSESDLRAYETEVLGSEHAAEHAQDRRDERRDLRRWRALSPRERRHEVAHERRRSRRLARRTAARAPASEIGRWTHPPFALPNSFAIHSVMLPTGKVLYWGFPADPPNVGNGTLWDPSKGSRSGGVHRRAATGRRPRRRLARSRVSSRRSTARDSRSSLTARSSSPGGTWCCRAFSDGLSGLGLSLTRAFTFNPWTERWTEQPQMNDGRWYPTQVELADGRTITIGGYGDDAPGKILNLDLEIFKPGSSPSSVGSFSVHPEVTPADGHALPAPLPRFPTSASSSPALPRDAQ